jgi:uracil-DNA glycosylase family protein
MQQPYPGAAQWARRGASIAELAQALADCRGCDLAENGTNPVFGAGPHDARVMIIGEQPGDVEERRGQPFVGPAGKLLDRALEQAGIDRRQVWVTNSVLHFKFTQSAPTNRRIHQTPNAEEVAACKPWLEGQLNRLRPELVILLGATAAKSLLGSAFRVTRQRGVLMPGPAGSGAQLIASIHPSAVLRGSDEERDTMFDGLVSDLRVAASVLAKRVVNPDSTTDEVKEVTEQTPVTDTR